MFCNACGVKNVADSNFCKQCGHKLDRAAGKIAEAAFDAALPEAEQLDALLERAYRLRREHNLEGAVALCEEALRLRPGSTSAHSLLGQLYALSGQQGAAVREYERVLELNPGSIADRMKLDELRDETAQAPTAPRPRIVLAERDKGTRRGYNSSANRFLPVSRGAAMVAAAGAFVALGGWIGVKMHARDERFAARPLSAPRSSQSRENVNENRANGPVAVSLPDTMNSMRGAGTTATASDAQTAQGALSVAQTPPAAADNRAQADSPFLPNLYPPFAYAAPPATRTVYVQAASAPSGETAPSARHGILAASVSPPRLSTRAASNNAVSAARDSGDGRVRLADDNDNLTESDRNHYVVRVSQAGGKEKESGEPTAPKARPQARNYPPPMIRLSDPVSAGGDNGGAASGEASGLIALASDRKLKGDYGGAISIYQRALNSAGDRAGYVRQQIAYCFQQKGDRNSAITNYQRAIGEYEKLTNGRQAESARIGIRACEQGIKRCSAE